MDLTVTTFNICIALLGGWATLFGIFSHVLKEKCYLSEALLSFLAGALMVGVANLLHLDDYISFTRNADGITLDFSRLVLGVQLVLAGVQLPARYLQTERKSLAVLLGPGMAAMWLFSSLAIWLTVPGLAVLPAMAVAACVTPTDPVLSDGIVKGRFADAHVPIPLRHLIIAESGANDGLGYPFLFFALYLIKYTALGGGGSPGGGGSGDDNTVALQGGGPLDLGPGDWRRAAALFVGETCGFVVVLSVLYGWLVGSAARVLLRWAKRHDLVDRESFLAFALSLALLVSGTCGMVGSDDVLACFVAGNAFTLDDWFRLETVQEPVQPTVDMMLNTAVFVWLGAACPWAALLGGRVVPLAWLALLAPAVLLLRRLPFVLAARRLVRQIDGVGQAVFVGYFGPIGVSAIFYLYVGREFLDTVTTAAGNKQRPDAKHLADVMEVVIWFLVACSIIIHGLTVPLLHFGEKLFRSRRIALPP